MDQSYIRKNLETSRLSPGKKTNDPRPPDDDTCGPGVSPTKQPACRETQEPLREGHIDSVKVNGLGEEATCVAICSGLFSQQENIRELAKLGMTVLTSSGVKGTLLSPFGKVGKCKIEFAQGNLVQVGDSVLVG